MRAYPPSAPGGYWRLRWMEADRRRETTASSRDEVLAKAGDLVARLAQGRPTDWSQAEGDALVAHYLESRRPVRGRAWSARHREEQEAYCARFVAPVIAHVELRRLSRVHFAQVLAQATTASVAAHLRRCCSAMVAAGLEEGLLLARQDVLRGVHWSPPAGQPRGEDFATGQLIQEADIPTATATAALAAATVQRSGVWWRELQVLVVAYSGLRWGVDGSTQR
ncbi:MAG TPA: hypothetical protein VNT56_12330 [Acidimicrobiales bacterium]|nr:hypothetical protein [Acidimicrobiales bacterium]